MIASQRGIQLSYILRNSPEKIGNFSVEAVLSTFLSQHENQKKSFLKPVGISSKNVNRAFSLTKTWSKCLTNRHYYTIAVVNTVRAIAVRNIK